MYKRHRGFSEMSIVHFNKNLKDVIFEDIVVGNYQNFAKWYQSEWAQLDKCKTNHA